MLRFLARFSEPESSFHTRSWADFTTTTPELKFSVHTTVHMTAGHNTLRGSGPGQKPAFDNVMAQVGCPDRRIDRLLQYVLFALPTFTSRRLSGAISFSPPARRVACNARPWP